MTLYAVTIDTPLNGFTLEQHVDAADAFDAQQQVEESQEVPIVVSDVSEVTE